VALLICVLSGTAPTTDAIGAWSEVLSSISMNSVADGTFFVRGVLGDVERARRCLKSCIRREIGRE
jgi:hypothetical protein